MPDNISYTHLNQDMDMDWKTELQNIIKVGCTDSDIEDFIEKHPEVHGRGIWNYVYENIAPPQCKGCKYIQRIRFALPCITCSRGRSTAFPDHYEKR